MEFFSTAFRLALMNELDVGDEKIFKLKLTVTQSAPIISSLNLLVLVFNLRFVKSKQIYNSFQLECFSSQINISRQIPNRTTKYVVCLTIVNTIR